MAGINAEACTFGIAVFRGAVVSEETATFNMQNINASGNCNSGISVYVGAASQSGNAGF